MVMCTRVVVMLVFAAGVARADFASEQERAPRVRQARLNKGAAIREAFVRAGVAYPPGQVFIRALKREATVELWAATRPADALVLVKSWPVCAASGGPGPKRRQGDGQVPEGFYQVDRFNPYSSYHLSLGLDYPNASDRVRAGAHPPGGDIFIHGQCVTIGCLPIEDGPIEELYVALLDARAAGVRRVPVHVFPGRMDDDGWARLEKGAAGDAALLEFWRELRPAYLAFERTRHVPRVRVEPRTGRYLLVD